MTLLAFHHPSKFSFLFLLLFNVVIGYSQSSSINIKADGKSDDWKNVPVQEEKDIKVYYAVQNDPTGINILIKSTDRMMQSKMLMGGMQFFIDLSGKKNKTTGFNYPLPGKMENFRFNRQGMRSNDTTQRRRMLDSGFRQRPDSLRRGRFDMKKMREQMLETKKEIEIFGFSDENNGLSNVSESPLNVGIGWDEKDTMVYEIHVPYAAFNKPPSAGDKIAIGVVFKGMQIPDFGDGNRDGGGERRGGGGFGGMPQGGMMMGGGGTEANAMDFMKLFEENSFWIKYNLTSF